MDTSNTNINNDSLANFSEEPPSNVETILNTPIADYELCSSDLGETITKSDCENPTTSPSLKHTSLFNNGINVSVNDKPIPQLSINFNIPDTIVNIEKPIEQTSEIRSPKRIKLSTTGFLNIAICNHSEH